MKNKDDALLTVKQVAVLLNCKPSTIYSWVELRTIPFIKLNGLLRFSESEILGWMNSCKNGSAAYNGSSGRRPGKEGNNNGSL